MNMRKYAAMQETSVRLFCGIEAKPAVRKVTDSKRLLRMAIGSGNAPIVSGLRNSAAKTTAVPAEISTSVSVSTSLLCSVKRLKISLG